MLYTGFQRVPGISSGSSCVPLNSAEGRGNTELLNTPSRFYKHFLSGCYGDTPSRLVLIFRVQKQEVGAEGLGGVKARPLDPKNKVWDLEPVTDKMLVSTSLWPSRYKSTCQCRGHGLDPWSGKIPHAMGQLSQCAAITEPVLQSLCSATREATAVSPCTTKNNSPARCNQRKPTCNNTDPAWPKVNT